jgi:glycosyltransferase involved in cell wall biosynthesis
VTRVLHVITGLHAGGAEAQLPLLLAGAGGAGGAGSAGGAGGVGGVVGATAEVVSLTPPGAVADRLRALGVPVHVVPMRGNTDVAALPRLVRLVRDGGYDAVHLHLFRSLVHGAPAARLAGVPTVVFTEHSLNARLVEGRPVTAGVRALYRSATSLVTTVVAVSEGVRERLVALGVPAAKVVVVPNALDAAALAPDADRRARARAALGAGEGTALLGVVGRLAVPKRVDRLLTAAAPLLGPERRLVVVGDGPERARLERLARELRVGPHVSFLGETDDVPGVLCALDALVSPSPEETFGLAVVEARLAGLPTAYACCPGLDELGLRDPGARRVGADVPSLRAAVAQLLAGAPARVPAPAALRQRYDVATTRDRLAQLHRGGRPTPARPGVLVPLPRQAPDMLARQGPRRP